MFIFKSPLRSLFITIIVIALLALVGPEEQSLGSNVRIVYLHGADITPIIGGDSLRDLPTWHNPKELLFASHWVGVVRRPGEQPNMENLERELPGISSKIHYVDAPLLEIASREIRSRIANHLPFRYYVPLPVCHYIEQHHLYQQSETVDRQS